jgi:hypothetical protein
MKSRNKTVRGEMASSELAENQSKNLEFEEFRGKLALVRVRYKDHILFKNCNPTELSPSVREVVGWLTFESSEAICVCYDKPVDPSPNEKRQSGFVILKSDILEMFEIEVGKSFKQILITDYGQKAL